MLQNIKISVTFIYNKDIQTEAVAEASVESSLSPPNTASSKPGRFSYGLAFYCQGL